MTLVFCDGVVEKVTISMETRLMTNEECVGEWCRVCMYVVMCVCVSALVWE